MNRNVSVVVILLVLVVIAGYLIWLRSKVAPSVTSRIEPTIQATPLVSATMTASPSATPGREATSSARPRTATPGATRR